MDRLFVAIALPAALVDRLQGLCTGIRGARWMRPDQMHLTVRFIGNANGMQFHDICDSLGAIGGDPFPLALRGLGHFPPRGAARVIWVGVEPSPALARLHDKIEAAINALGFEPEPRNYAPHVTLARFKRPAPSHRVGDYLALHGAFATEPFEVDAFHLFSSHLAAGGAHYRLEASFPLGDGLEFPSFEME